MELRDPPVELRETMASRSLNTENVLYTIRTTVYGLVGEWRLSTLMLSMKRRLPKSRLVIVAAAGVPSEGAI